MAHIESRLQYSNRQLIEIKATILIGEGHWKDIAKNRQAVLDEISALFEKFEKEGFVWDTTAQNLVPYLSMAQEAPLSSLQTES